MSKRKQRDYSVEELRALLRYDPETGLFHRLKTCGRAKAGTVAGSRTDLGYVTVGVLGDHCLAHVLAWFYMTGKWPEATIDHANRVRSDNRWANLREASVNEQMWNRNKSAGKSSRFIGVSRFAGGRWRAAIRVRRNFVSLGLFDTEEAAAAAYQSAKARLHPIEIVGSLH